MIIVQKSKKKKLILCAVICTGVLIGIIITINLSKVKKLPKQYMITTRNHIDYQPHYECSGYASAYVLRNLGLDLTGLEVYKLISHKNSDGTVPPKTLVNGLEEQGYSAKLHTGSTMQLKQEVSKGLPVIVFVRTSPKEDYYHYLPIVGYDEENLYAAESLKYKENAKNEYYNRIITNSDFDQMWDTGVFKNNTYITIQLDN